jgi:hypothetical protein
LKRSRAITCQKKGQGAEHRKQIQAWLTERIAAGAAITPRALRLHALTVRPGMKTMWWSRARKILKIRYVSAKRMTTLDPDIIDLRLNLLFNFIRVRPAVTVIVSFDQVPGSPAGHMSPPQLAVAEGSQDIARLNPNHYKRCCSWFLISACFFDGTNWQGKMLPLLCLVKHNAKTPRATLELHGIRFVFNSTGVITSALMINEVLPWIVDRCSELVPNASLRVVFDSASGHRSKATLAYLRDRSIQTVVIPGGCTQFVQHVDVYQAQQFKDRYGDKYMSMKVNTQKLKVADLPELLGTCGSHAWEAVRELEEPKLVRHFTKLGYLNPTPESVSLRARPNFKFVVKAAAEVKKETGVDIDESQAAAAQPPVKMPAAAAAPKPPAKVLSKNQKALMKAAQATNAPKLDRWVRTQPTQTQKS